MTNSESKVPWPFRDEHKKGLRSKHVKLPSMQSELTSEVKSSGADGAIGQAKTD